ncbi:MAG TPA: hypothetical protein VG389_18450 [Myxococcota bacterium]|nr:hypothetical protein [Myxococcota bacterium]
MRADETGTPGTVDADDASADSNIERVGPTMWRVRSSDPTPRDCSLIR